MKSKRDPSEIDFRLNCSLTTLSYSHLWEPYRCAFFSADQVEILKSQLCHDFIYGRYWNTDFSEFLAGTSIVFLAHVQISDDMFWNHVDHINDLYYNAQDYEVEILKGQLHSDCIQER